jgi:methionyl-tRNA synthetase
MALYISTPIYYVNDRPHIGHIYSTVVADVLARFHRQRGQSTVLSTGTDEHAVKVAEAAREANREVVGFAADHAAAFRASFLRFGVAFDDFIRTSEPRHIREVRSTCESLLRTGDIYLGSFEGWYDEGQEEYVADTKAGAAGFAAANGRPLVRRSEENYFFRLSRFQQRVVAAIQEGRLLVTPAARRAEVLSRLREPLRDVPISRKTDYEWGVVVPGTNDHRVYVWVDALLNYRTVAKTANASGVWPPALHLIGKEILWFHAVLWPAILFAFGEAEGEATLLPQRIHAHSHWTHDGVKISKSLGNAVGEAELASLSDDGTVAVEGLRYFFAARGPIGAADADYSRDELVRFYNAELANGFGNAVSRVLGLLDRYLGRSVPRTDGSSTWHAELERLARACESSATAAIADLDLPAYVGAATALVRRVNGIIQETEPYRLLKADRRSREAAAILGACLEALLFASDTLAPVIPRTAARLRAALGVDGSAAAPTWGRLQAGRPVSALAALFPRAL